jgi:hypothetical protein
MPGGGSDAGVAIDVAVEHLAIVGGKRSKIPTLRLRRVSLRAQIAVSARLRYSRQTGWRFESFSVTLKRWSAPGVLSRTTASMVLKLVRPTLREAVIR